MGNQQALTQNKRLQRAKLDHELVDGLLEGDLNKIKSHLDRDKTIDLECLADYACELGQADAFMLIMTHFPGDADVDALFLQAYENDLISGHDDDFMKEFLPVIQHRSKMLETICEKGDLTCFKIIKDDLTEEELKGTVKLATKSARGGRIVKYIQRYELLTAADIEEAKKTSSAGNQMLTTMESMNKFVPGIKKLLSAAGYEEASNHIDKCQELFTGASLSLVPTASAPTPELDKKIKSAIRKDQKNRIRHALRDGLHPADILDYAYKHDKDDVYLMVAAYMSDEPGYDKYFELGLRKGWFEPDDETYTPKYTKPGAMAMLAPMLSQFSGMMKSVDNGPEISQKCKVAIRKGQNNRIRHAIREGQNVVQMVQYAKKRKRLNSLEYIMSIWPEGVDATDAFTSNIMEDDAVNQISMKYIHLVHDKYQLAKQYCQSYDHDMAIFCIKLCSPEQIAAFPEDVIKMNNLSLIKNLADHNLIPNYPKFLRCHNLRPESMMDIVTVMKNTVKTIKTM